MVQPQFLEVLPKPTCKLFCKTCGVVGCYRLQDKWLLHTEERSVSPSNYCYQILKRIFVLLQNFWYTKDSVTGWSVRLRERRLFYGKTQLLTRKGFLDLDRLRVARSFLVMLVTAKFRGRVSVGGGVHCTSRRVFFSSRGIFSDILSGNKTPGIIL